MLAGMAIDGGGTGIAHAIGHALGTLAHVPHGVAVAIGLGAALDWNVDGGDGAYASGRGGARLLASPTCPTAFDAAARRLPASPPSSPGSARWRSTPTARRGAWSPRRTCRCTTTTAGCAERRRPAPCWPSRTLSSAGSDVRRRERDRPHRDHPPPAAARPAVPRRVGPAAAHGVPGDDRAGRRRRRPRRASAPATRCTASPTTSG